MGIDCETQKRTIREGKKCPGKQQWFVGMEGDRTHRHKTRRLLRIKG